MKNLRRALSLFISTAIITLSPGLAPYQAFAQTVTSAVSASAQGSGVAGLGAVSAGAGSNLSQGPGAAVTILPSGVLELPATIKALPNVLSSAQEGTIAAPAGRSASEMAAAAAQALPQTAVITGKAGAATAANAVFSPAVHTQAGKQAPRAGAGRAAAQNLARSSERPTAFQRLSAEIPDFRRMGSDAAKGALDADMLVRTGEAALSGAGGVLAAAEAFGTGAKDVSLSKSRSMPERGRKDGGPFVEDDERGGNSEDVSGLDELGNPRRDQSDGPDSASDEFGESSGGGFLAALPVAISIGATAGLAAIGNIAFIPVYLGLILPSIILHEMGHAWTAQKLGDPTPVLQGRLSFKPRDLLTHIDPLMTIALPIITILTTGLLLGAARPVVVNKENFVKPEADMAKVALAGPAVNFGLAVLGGFAHGAALALGLAPVAGALSLFVFFNVTLGLFNLLPFAPLDGHHIVRWFLNSNVVNRLIGGHAISASLDRHPGIQAAVGFLLAMTVLAPVIMGLAHLLAGSLLIGPAVAGTVQLASGLLPAAAAIGLMLGPIVASRPEGVGRLRPGPVEAAVAPVSARPEFASPQAEPIKLLVRLNGAAKPLSSFVHLDLVLPHGRKAYVSQADAVKYAAAYRQIVSDVEAAGLSRDILNRYGASPVATYDLINTATILVPSDKAAALRAELEARGFRVDANAERRIIEPVVPNPNRPDSPASSGWGALTMQDMLKLSNAQPAHDAGKALWGEPVWEPGVVDKIKMKLRSFFGAPVPEVPVAVIDSGIDTEHPQLKRVKEVINVTSGENKDDIGHGSWCHSMVLWFAPWLRSSIHIKTFVDGGATTDDILKALSTARQKGAIITSNSWGDDQGDPEGPDSKLVYEMAKEGRIMVFAAGNAGSGANTVGAPAIMHFKDPQTGAIRVLAVAATDKNKKVAYFSSRGPGSPITSTNDKYKDWPHRPDLAEQGYNTEAAWPSYLRPDRVDPKLGPVKAISGTSMSTPKVAGTIALLCMLFGVTEIGPKLDAVVNAVMSTLEKIGEKDDLGEGFNVVGAAYATLAKTLKPVMKLPKNR